MEKWEGGGKSERRLHRQATSEKSSLRRRRLHEGTARFLRDDRAILNIVFYSFSQYFIDLRSKFFSRARRIFPVYFRILAVDLRINLTIN